MEYLEIGKKEDVIIPFDNMEDPNWEVKTRLIIEGLNESLGLTENVPPRTIQKIEELEKKLGTTLPSTLKLFYLTFGLTDLIDNQLFKFKKVQYFESRKTPFWQRKPHFEKKDLELLSHLINFSEFISEGNIFCFHRVTNEIYFIDFDDRPYISKMFNDFEDYLKCSLILAQTELYVDGLEQDIQEWTADIVSDLIGKDVLSKWTK